MSGDGDEHPGWVPDDRPPSAGLMIERPEGYSDGEWEAFQAGFRRAANRLASVAGAMSAAEASEPEERDDTCSECGGRKIREMGTDGFVCPSCDLGH